MWYTTGKINVTKNSDTVTGIGTKWSNPLSGVSAGGMLILQSSNQVEIYEIASVQSDTRLTLAENYNGVTAKDKTYKIPTSPSVSIEQFALEIASSLAYHQQQLDGWQKILTGSGDVELIAPDGQKVIIKSQKQLSNLIDNAVKKSGDEMTGQLRMSAESAGIKFKYEESNDEFVLRTLSNSLSFIFYDEQIEKWSTKLAYITDKKQWCFLDVDDVTINNKSALKEGDAVQLFGDLANANINDLTGLREGVYFQGRNVQATTENNYPVNESGTLQVLKNGADGAGCCQIYTAYRNARQFIRNYRGGTK
ncbi:pyocin knob domain-containing protein, partial [Gilliamella sp. GillExp13]|uniref:pyocin knob domain-containing protein n=1 Tax=Gilliamella sp. GillExp13 TaxID=3120243 RepID=UPI001C3FFD22